MRGRKWFDRQQWVLWIITVVAVIGFFFSGYEALYGGEKCDEFKAGYIDGYCSPQKFVCYRPSYIPLCIDSDYDTAREAYHVGYGLGRGARLDGR